MCPSKNGAGLEVKNINNELRLNRYVKLTHTMIYVLYTWYIRQILISIENMQMHRHIIFFNIFGLSVGLFYLYDKAIYINICMYIHMKNA